ncbi:phosphonate ABC transporter substrate-binding protein [Nitratireductor aquibiodomus]|uniref:phosphonate ABC transporter substrate-binding protein n=1 Tax=Nitratireductor aquibiodomus TaxID=204799 RepID=UPI0019D3DA05|nr:phosphonate ABC transporter substrate-binding protein [Nitratireductor aquibiodomus]MBN7760532.1 phosphonate ABC transporter substrate-binding protein [Nitratireductor aquibiodomus]
MHTLTRRGFVAALVSLALASPVLAQDWREEYPELTIGISSSENETDAITRNQPYADYLSRELGVPVNLIRGTDYAAVIEAIRSGHVQVASVGPAAYALARKIMGEEIAPVAVTLDSGGNLGYYSIIAVRADSPYQNLEDIKGKSFAFADPNSTSGYAVPSYYLSTELETSPNEYFGEVAFSGGHEQSVMALVNGTFEAVATHWRNEEAGNIQTMERKGLIEPGSTRIIWKSPVIPNTPVMMLTSLPEELQEEFKTALMAFPEKDPEGFAEYTRGTSSGYSPAKHEDYLNVVAITEFNAKERRKNKN